MTEDKLLHYKQILLKEREEVIEELIDSEDSAKALLEDELHNVNDTIDEASSTVTQTILSIMSKNNQQKVLAIESALRRVVEGSYGVCISCGDQISEPRLESVPWTTLCIGCKIKTEKK